MANQTGRTVSKFVKFYVDNGSAVVKEIAVDSINGVGLDYPAKDFAAFQDAIHAVLPEIPDCEITITGPFDNSAEATASASGAAPALSGSHTVLSGIVGGVTPLTLCIAFGIRQYYTTGEPVFGLAGTTANGFLCLSYVVDPGEQKYTAKFRVCAGSAIPAWGAALLT
jgi:hypothetical protein